MNQDAVELYNKINKDFAILEREQKLRWELHDKRSGESRIMIKEIHTKMVELPCDVHKERFKSIFGKLNWVWTILGILILSIVGLAVTIVGK